MGIAYFSAISLAAMLRNFTRSSSASFATAVVSSIYSFVPFISPRMNCIISSYKALYSIPSSKFQPCNPLLNSTVSMFGSCFKNNRIESLKYGLSSAFDVPNPSNKISSFVRAVAILRVPTEIESPIYATLLRPISFACSIHILSHSYVSYLFILFSVSYVKSLISIFPFLFKHTRIINSIIPLARNDSVTGNGRMYTIPQQVFRFNIF